MASVRHGGWRSAWAPSGSVNGERLSDVTDTSVCLAWTVVPPLLGKVSPPTVARGVDRRRLPQSVDADRQLPPSIDQASQSNFKKKRRAGLGDSGHIAIQGVLVLIGSS